MRVSAYRHIADPDQLLDLGLFVAEGRLVVRRLLDLQHWAIESILLTQPAADALVDVLPKTAAPIYLADQAADERASPASTSIAAASRWSGARRRRRSIASRPDRCRACSCSKASTIPTTSAGCFAAPRPSASSWSSSARTAAIRCIAKPIRTSMGATLSMPFAQAPQWPGAIADLRADGFTVVALTPAMTAAPLEEIFPARQAGAAGRARRAPG